jgi:hypothetical protein
MGSLLGEAVAAAEDDPRLDEARAVRLREAFTVPLREALSDSADKEAVAV